MVIPNNNQQNNFALAAEKTKKIISEIFSKNVNEISEETSFISDLHAKSIDTIALLAALEGEFKIKIPSQEVQGNQTVGQAIAYIESKLFKNQE